MINRDRAFICKLKIVKGKKKSRLSSVIDLHRSYPTKSRVKNAKYKLSEKNVAKKEEQHEA